MSAHLPAAVPYKIITTRFRAPVLEVQMYGLACQLHYSKGQYCQNVIANLAFSDDDADQSILKLPKDTLCSECIINLGRLLQGTSFSNYGKKMAQEWQSIQSSCGVSYPTDVQPIAGNQTDIPGYAPSGYPVAMCNSGKTYTVPGVVWNGTAIPYATATQTAVYATTTVHAPGPIPSGTTKQCGRYYEVKTGDYCQLIALNNTITVTLFGSINPSINSGCTNLIPGFFYCVFPALGWNDTKITTSSYVTPPAPTPSGSTSNCYEWHVVVSGDDCSKIGTEYGLTLDQLRQWNPQLKADCSNLLLDDAYCVYGDSAATTLLSYATPPAPTPSGITDKCYQWHVVVSGDYCAKIESQFNITMAEFQSWNPQMNNDCTNLLLGEAYCVRGDSQVSGRRALPARMPAVQTASAF
ncbi:LysM domain-containing protein [Cordyceps javanica]|uniref:LysM domain-containing protein n=1 Tax=Cordyceps javanica TaxID=43265 RepID=A0A545V6R1_9HYPO|nr:LysM domain-containing protein [Cordyceps javanica]TQW08621.1 LysM domain protein [Cordyceps javanica]